MARKPPAAVGRRGEESRDLGAAEPAARGGAGTRRLSLGEQGACGELRNRPLTLDGGGAGPVGACVAAARAVRAETHHGGKVGRDRAPSCILKCLGFVVAGRLASEEG